MVDEAAGPPADDAYGRVTNPERYRVLHAAADAVVADLERRFDVRRREGLDVDAALAARAPGTFRIVHIEPRSPRAAAITVAWTAFPGVVLRLGAMHTEPLPTCGCDACDEDPAHLTEELHAIVDAVTAGRFREWTDGSRVGFEFERADGRHRAGWQLKVAVAGDRGMTDVTWAPWPPRRHQ